MMMIAAAKSANLLGGSRSLVSQVRSVFLDVTNGFISAVTVLTTSRP